MPRRPLHTPLPPGMPSRFHPIAPDSSSLRESSSECARAHGGRPYQVELAHDIVGALETPLRQRGALAESGIVSSALVVVPTGGGKTHVALSVVTALQRHANVTMGWCAARRELLAQAKAEARAFGFAVDFEPISLFAAVPHRTAIISASRATEISHAHGEEGLTYSDGIITSRHMPAADPGGFHVGPDKFAPRFSARLPLDGFGDPKLFVAMLRLACTNGVIGMTREFASTVRLGCSPAHALDRALGSYANADGFSAVRRRLEAAQSAWASVAEVMMLERVLSSISWGGGDAAGHRRAAFDRMTGDFGSMYGVASFTAISARQRTLLPTRARAYQLINFATEMATHHAPPVAATRLQAWFGSYISRDFDLEGTAQEDAEFDALLIPALPAPRRAHGNHGTRAARARRA